MAAIASTPRNEGAVADESGAGVTPKDNAASCAIDLKVLWPDAITNLKTAPRQLVEVYKAFYMQCPPKCEQTGQDMKEMIRPAYFIHFQVRAPQHPELHLVPSILRDATLCARRYSAWCGWSI